MPTLDATRTLVRDSLGVDLGSIDRGSGRQRGHLVVEREDIWFESLPGDRDTVLIRIHVHNGGTSPSGRARLHVEAAPFGAFLPWRPLTAVDVPSVAPGATHTVEFKARVERRGDAAGLSKAPTMTETYTAFGRLKPMLLLPDDQLRANLHSSYWAGNLNVWVDRDRPVERHMARGLRAVAGVPNLALFQVGSSRPDAYQFELSGPGAGWSARLFRLTAMSLRDALVSDGGTIAPGDWLEVRGTTAVYLSFNPPPGCARGELVVHVRQRSTGRAALVEFGFDPQAAGAGCYTV